MAQKIKKWEEFITIEGETSKIVSYVDYFSHRPLFSSLQLKNTADEVAQELTLTITNENGLKNQFDCVIL